MEEIRLRPGLRLTRSARVEPRQYRLTEGIHVAADEVTLDFQGAVLCTCDVHQGARDTFEGVGIRIEGRKNVTIRNAVIRGFRYNVFAAGCEGLRLENCDVSFSRAQRIASGGFPVSVWLVLRSLEEWRTFGSGIWLENCSRSEVVRCRGTSAQNGIILCRCDRCRVYDCDFSFNSGWGVALWESCDNDILWNLADFVNRPYAGDLGADSSGMACVNASHRNYFVGNSFTHGGDGFFLTDLVDGGHDGERYHFEGSSNDNVIAYNDGSFGGNAFEGTFSYRNVYYRNVASHSSYGFWLGFSRDSLVLDNEIEGNRWAGIGIEHGAGTRISRNVIRSDRGHGIRLWTQPGPGREEFPSRDIEIRRNRIHGPQAYDLHGTTEYAFEANVLSGGVDYDPPSTKRLEAIDARERFLRSSQYRRVQRLLRMRPTGFRFYREQGLPMGLEWLQVDDYAPHDFRRDLAAYCFTDPSALSIWPRRRVSLSVSGGVSIHRGAGQARVVRPAELQVAPGRLVPCKLSLQRAGETQEIGVTLSALVWSREWHAWHGIAFEDEAAWDRLFSGMPTYADYSRTLGWDSASASPAPGLGRQHFALRATASVCVKRGDYRFRFVYDDALEFRVDGRTVLRRWERRRWAEEEILLSLSMGTHEFEVRYAVAEGHAVLRMFWGRMLGGSRRG
ncbi:MAG: hypothetical protein AMXMBFR61_15980 [Fimbriimonadales bacterium]